MEMVSDQLIQKIEEAAGQYYRLVLVVGPSGCGKTQTLQHVSERKAIPLLSMNLEISRLLLELTEKQRALQVAGLIGDFLDGTEQELLLLDNTEILFEPALQQEPLRLLQSLSRNRTIVASWNGTIEGGYLLYAEAEHPEYRRYPLQDFLYLSLQHDE
jgi:chromosomal replication initiation ATPase DnaA